MGWGQFKPLLTETTIEVLRPIQQTYTQVMDDKGYLESVLKQGREQAESVAQETLSRVKTAMGFSKPL